MRPADDHRFAAAKAAGMFVTDEMLAAERACRAEYPRSPNPLPHTRIVRCHLPAGHPGEHEEADTEVTWTNDDDARPAAVADQAQRAANTAELEAHLGPKPWHSDPGEPCTHPHCVAKADDADQAGEDVYRAAAEAMLPLTGVDDELYEWQGCADCEGPCSCSGTPYPSVPVRAAIDAAITALYLGLSDGEPIAAVLRRRMVEQARIEIAEAETRRIRAEQQSDRLRTQLAAADERIRQLSTRTLAKQRDKAIRERDEARAKVNGGEHPCLPLIVIADTGGNGLEVRCGNCGTYEPIGSGSEMDLAELRAWLDGHCEPICASCNQPYPAVDVIDGSEQCHDCRHDELIEPPEAVGDDGSRTDG